MGGTRLGIGSWQWSRACPFFGGTYARVANPSENFNLPLGWILLANSITILGTILAMPPSIYTQFSIYINDHSNS